MKCEKTCPMYAQWELTACEGCCGREKRKPIVGISVEEVKYVMVSDDTDSGEIYYP